MFGYAYDRRGFGGGCGARRGRGGRDGVAAQFAAGWSDAGGEFGRGRGRARRMFDGGELQFVLLKLIADEPRHGYELIRAIETLTGGAYVPSPGVIYPTLSLLDETGMIEQQASDGARKRFAATEDGRAHLAEHADAVERLFARLAELGSERNRVGWMRSPVQRAFGNLRHAVQNRMPRGTEDDEMLFGIAALIDEAAQKIERLK